MHRKASFSPTPRMLTNSKASRSSWKLTGMGASLESGSTIKPQSAVDARALRLRLRVQSSTTITPRAAHVTRLGDGAGERALAPRRGFDGDRLGADGDRSLALGGDRIDNVDLDAA